MLLDWWPMKFSSLESCRVWVTDAKQLAVLHIIILCNNRCVTFHYRADYLHFSLGSVAVTRKDERFTTKISWMRDRESKTWSIVFYDDYYSINFNAWNYIFHKYMIRNLVWILITDFDAFTAIFWNLVVYSEIRIFMCTKTEQLSPNHDKTMMFLVMPTTLSGNKMSREKN